jgi:hypothetical protein
MQANRAFRLLQQHVKGLTDQHHSVPPPPAGEAPKEWVRGWTDSGKELSGVGTSSAGITGTTGNLNDGAHDGGVGKPSARDAGNRAAGLAVDLQLEGECAHATGLSTEKRVR